LSQPIAVALARAADRPVKMIFTREEEFIAARPRHATTITVKVGAKRDGMITAKSVRLLFDTGAYADDGPGIAGFGGMMARGPYRVPNLKIESHCVYTNKVKTGAFRGFGNPQATFASESMMDMLAEALGMDPVELRLKNGVEPGDLAVGGQVMRSVRFKDCLSKAAEAIRWDQKPGLRRGKGVAGINHISGLLSSGASVRMSEDGTFVLMVGAVDIGQGSDTVLVQILAEELGVTADQISVVSGDTDATPYNWAVAASRTTFTAGNAVRKAGAEVKRQILELAADLLEANPVDLEARGGFVTVKGVPGRRVSYRELGLASHWVRRGPILGSASYMVEGPAYDPKRTIMTGFPFGPVTAYIFGVHAVEVEVDTDTGQVTIVDAVAAHDVGRAVNPALVEGQIQGGFMQGVGYALLEALHLDGGRITNPSFMDYRLPSALDAPPARTIILEGGDEAGPFGAKGVGEPPIVGPAPAIANAIYRAVGVRIRELPITPERVLRALRTRGVEHRSGEASEGGSPPFDD
jgi:CO/xanthine dehydrogenase Mo-binding subunit